LGDTITNADSRFNLKFPVAATAPADGLFNHNVTNIPGTYLSAKQLAAVQSSSFGKPSWNPRNSQSRRYPPSARPVDLEEGRLIRKSIKYAHQLTQWLAQVQFQTSHGCKLKVVKGGILPQLLKLSTLQEDLVNLDLNVILDFPWMTSVTSLSVSQRVLTGKTYLTSKFKLSNYLSTLYPFIALALSSSVNGLIDVEKPITTAGSRKWIDGVTQENVRSTCAPTVSSLVCVRLMIFSLVMVSFIELHRSRVQPTCTTSGTFPASWYSYNPVTKTYVGSSDRRVCQSTQSDKTRLPFFRIATKTWTSSPLPSTIPTLL
jgi:hypothetical protein